MLKRWIDRRRGSNFQRRTCSYSSVCMRSDVRSLVSCLFVCCCSGCLAIRNRRDVAGWGHPLWMRNMKSQAAVSGSGKLLFRHVGCRVDFDVVVLDMPLRGAFRACMQNGPHGFAKDGVGMLGGNWFARVCMGSKSYRQLCELRQHVWRAAALPRSSSDELSLAWSSRTLEERRCHVLC